ncbi:hypothetical protein Micbo1qcDRAFT_232278 [Microdochium bolleyi]|uniref:Uncharacterized protein n=1 Tax=Microdochium bolleyi TaxID=196109 RepID=A0A136JCL1_9PEZI|nr:hypothetical protein Micbo1qcDRAFT_232278 [Microdochium bolleyi]
MTTNFAVAPGYPDDYQPESGTTAVASLLNNRAHTRFPKWGFVIFRGVYGNNAEWDTFISLYKAQVALELHSSAAGHASAEEELGSDLEWTIVEDRAALEDVPKDAVRARFREWVAARSVARDGVNGDAPWLPWHVPRFRYCLYVNEACLRSISVRLWGEQFGAGWGLSDGRIIIIDGTRAEQSYDNGDKAKQEKEREEYSDEDEDEDEDEDDMSDDYGMEDAIEGNTEWDVGWTYVEVIGNIGRYAGLCGTQGGEWELLYRIGRPSTEPQLSLSGAAQPLSAVPAAGPFRHPVDTQGEA